MQAKIHFPDPATEFLTEERCHILESWNSPDDSSVSIAKIRVEPGVSTANHVLDKIHERYVILSGEGSVVIGDLPPAKVVAGDVVIIPANTPQRISNTGDTDLIFYAICTPRFEQSCYRKLDN